MSKNFISRAIKWYRRPNKNSVSDLIESLIVILPVVFVIKTFFFGLYQVPTCSMETTMLVGERFFADKLTPFFLDPKRGEIISFNNPESRFSENKLMNFYQQYVDWNIMNYTKRVIATPGDHIQGKVEDGKPVVYLNGERLDEPYLNKYPIISVSQETLSMFGDFLYREPVRRSYDPKVSFNDQPFYRLNPVDIAIAKKYKAEGGKTIFEPATPSYGYKGKCFDEFDVKLGDNEYWMMGDNRLGSSDSRYWGPLNTKKSIFHGRILFRIWSVDSNYSWWIFDLIAHPIDFWSRMRWSRFFQFIN